MEAAPPVYPPGLLVPAAWGALPLSSTKGNLGWVLGISFFTETAVKYWNCQPREVAESPPLGVFKKGLKVTLGVMVWLRRCWGMGWTP